jgi:hypothetical protein
MDSTVIFGTTEVGQLGEELGFDKHSYVGD